MAVVDLDADAVAAGLAPELHAGVGTVVVGLTSGASPEAHPASRACDLVLARGDAALESVIATVDQNPIAALAAAVLLRGSERRSVDDGLMAESAVYSALQAGPEFTAWRSSRPIVDRPRSAQPVLLERAGGVLHITLNRPEVRNAFSTAMRDQLVDALSLPALDPTITEVHLRGGGDAFCSGGDLDEFGSFEDPASAHLVRLQQSVGRCIAAVSERMTAHLHGACVGSGIELPAFAHRVLARPDTVISLPEVSLGLVPGAGGTVSLPRRIGRLRTARLVLSGERIDAGTALLWGLVDAIEDSSPG
ncbi:MAG: enoyl-CoA hydratase/isomerase family protein [Acidimicrobiales bacterium]